MNHDPLKSYHRPPTFLEADPKLDEEQKMSRKISRKFAELKNK
jgi:hypothetical protein